MALNSDFQVLLTAASGDASVDAALEEILQLISEKAKEEGAKDADISSASQSFKKALLHAIEKGLTLSDAYQHAVGIFNSLIESSRNTAPKSQELKLLELLVSGKESDGGKGAKARGKGEEEADSSSDATAQFLKTLVQELSVGKSVQEAIESSKVKVALKKAVEAQENEFLEQSPTGKLLATLNSGSSVAEVLDEIAVGGDSAALEKSLNKALQGGDNIEQSAKKAKSNTDLEESLNDATPDNLALALSSGRQLDTAIDKEGGAKILRRLKKRLHKICKVAEARIKPQMMPNKLWPRWRI